MEATKIELSNVESTKMEMVAFWQQKEDNWLESLWDQLELLHSFRPR